jgi:hypothetical protein
MSLIRIEVIQKVEEEVKKGTKFLTFSYDVPSENKKKLKKEEKTDRLRRRLAVKELFRLHGIMVNNSTYIVSTNRCQTVLQVFDNIYKDLQNEKPSLVLIGNTYEYLVRELLKKYIDTLFKEIKDELSIADAEIESLKFEKSLEVVKNKEKRIKAKLYELEKKIDVLRQRILDYEILEQKSFNNLLDACTNLDIDRRILITRLD